jgi:putative flippase GtrA
MNAVRRILFAFKSREFGRFLFAGGTALVIHWLSRIMLNWFLGYSASIALAYLIGIVTAFLLNRIFVFPYSDRPLSAQLFIFFAINIAAFPVVWLAAYVLGEWVLRHWMSRDLAYAFAHGFAIALPVFVSFILHKYITFRKVSSS